MFKKYYALIIIFSLVVFMSCQKKEEGEKTLEKAPVEYVKAELAKLAPVDLQCDISHLSKADKACLKKLLQAAKLIDELFLLQVNPGNIEILSQLKQSNDPADKTYLDMFTIMFGPWNRIDNDKPFIGSAKKPLGAGYYPADLTKGEFENTIKEFPNRAKDLKSTFTLIQRGKSGLQAVPYHEAFQPLTGEVSRLLIEASGLTEDESLKKYLKLRGEAFLTDDYFDSDMAWMDLAGDLEVVIGPYEVYEDELFNYKGAYEAFICVVDHQESEKLMIVTKYLEEMESALPIPDKYKNMNRGLSSPIKVVQEVFSAGDTKAGVQTTAFNLPNDERVREAKGSKKVMLKNIAQAKYEKCWIPIVNTILAPEPLKNVSFESYFNHVLMHEMSHGLGPGKISLPDGKKMDVSKALKELYTVVEECKADVLGIITMKFLMDKGVFSKDDEYSMYSSYAGGMLRSIRFGIDEAHGGGVAIQFNYCFERGAFITDSEGRLDFDREKMIPALTELASKILLIQAEGDYEGAKQFIEKYRVMSPLMQKYVDMLKDVPIDIRPKYPEISDDAS
jgi:hypothetical protein